jgi:hypothetical protein
MSQSPVNSYVTPVGGATPGYASEVVFSDGTFVEGSTAELSADGPLREPYVAFCQVCELPVRCVKTQALPSCQQPPRLYEHSHAAATTWPFPRDKAGDGTVRWIKDKGRGRVREQVHWV